LNRELQKVSPYGPSSSTV